MKKTFITFLLVCMSVGCTASKWAVVDMNVIDETDPPRKTGSTLTVAPISEPTPDNPIFSLQIHEIQELEYTQRVLAERTVQQYQPRWGFTLLSLAGAGISFYAGNTDQLISNASTTQSIALNTTGAILTALAFTHMKPVGDPIRTGESKFLRKNGTVVRTDTVALNRNVELELDMRISYGENEIIASESYVTRSNEININIANLFREKSITGPNPGHITVDIAFQGENQTYDLPVSTFLQPFLHITTPVAELKSSPTSNTRSLLTEIEQGSELTFLNIYNEHWYEVQVGGTTSYIAREDGEIRWHSVDNVAGPSVITLDQVPFGELGIENSVPVLRNAGRSDRGFILSNHRNNEIGTRRYLERDYKLIDLYFRQSFDLDREQIYQLNITETDSAWSQAIETSGLDNLSTAFVYIGGFAKTDTSNGREVVKMIHRDEEGINRDVLLEDVLMSIAEKPQKKLIVFVDLEFRQTRNSRSSTGSVNGNGDILWLRLANRITRIQPNSALIFSASTNQHSGIYSNNQSEHMYHHIFPYFLAQGIQHRRTRIIDLVQYLENQVDYTSRRLFDRPQNVHAFGNLTIDYSGGVAPVQSN